MLLRRVRMLELPAEENLGGHVRNLDRGGRDGERGDRAVLHVPQQRPLEEMLALTLRVPPAADRLRRAVPQVLKKAAGLVTRGNLVDGCRV